jgi:hypothetical protein
MTRRIAIVIAWGLAGLAIAGGLIAGAFALAGEDIGQPATPPPPSATTTRGPDGDDRSRSPEAEPTETRTSEPVDDRGGGGNEPGDDHGGGEIGDDHGGSSNSGSDDSGSGSSDSGSGSDSSGSGSGSDDDGDD